jgi:aldehyde dehydrogenase (NAD+)
MIADRTAPTASSATPDVAGLFAEQRRRYRAAPYPPLAERLARLDRLGRALGAYRRALVEAMATDFRKPADESEFTEIVATLAELKFARANLAAWMKPQRVKTPASLLGSRAEVRCEPRGVALILAPWNYPVFLTLAPLIGALAAGCRAIVRPSEKAPATREVLAALVAEAFAPEDVACVGGEVDMAETLLALPFDHIFFTGSTRVGKVVMKAAAEHLASVTLELGGKSPCIVDDGADVGRAAGRIAWGRFINGGQTCVAPDYVLVHRSLERPLLDALATSVRTMFGRDDAAQRATPDYARLIDDGHAARIAGLIEASVAAGARVECGGGIDLAQRYVAPTILGNVSFEMPIMGEEIFGPVLPVLTYDSLDAALAAINARPKPLALYVFTPHDGVAQRVIAGTSSGGVLVNDTILHLANPNLPFGGVGESGMGNYHGYYGFKAFSHERAVMRQSPASLAPLLAPPYGFASRALTKLMERLP